MKRRLRLAVGILISILFLYLALRGIDWSRLVVLFRDARYGYLAFVFLVIVGVSWARAWRWHLLMDRDPALKILMIFHLVNIGYFFNNILPAKAGEAIRAYLAGRELDGGLGQAVSSLLIERLLDVLAVVVLLVVLLPFVPLPTWALRGGLLLGGGVIVGVLMLLLAARIGPQAVDWLWKVVGRVPVIGHERVKEALLNLVHGFSILAQGRRLPGILGATFLVWLGYALMNWLVLWVFDLQALRPIAALLVLCFTGLGMVVPSSPGAIGVFEWAGIQALAIFGVDASTAFGYTFGLHMFTNISLIALGAVGLISQGLDYARLSRLAAQGASVKESETSSLEKPA